MSLYGLLAGKGPEGFGYQSTAEEVTATLDLSGKRILVTGCSSGLGYETLRVLSLRGAQVIGAARTLAQAETACTTSGGRATAVACDLSNPGSVRACAATVRNGPPLDALVCNAGVMGLPRLQQAHGYELQFFVNHIGHFLLVTELLDFLAEHSRVVVVSSEAHRRAPPGGIEFDNLSGERGYRPFRAYGQSKMANLLFAKELARRLQGTGRTVNALHPGVIPTRIGRHLPPLAAKLIFGIGSLLFLKTIPQGAATQCYAAVHPAAAQISGAYLMNCQLSEPRSEANDVALAGRLWAVSTQIVAKLS
jgi:WW domain-containing oxidoreductase